MVDQQLVSQIATAYEGSRHGNSRFMKLMKLHSREVQEAVDQYLAAHGKTPQTNTATAVVPAPVPAKWEISLPFDELISIHLNAAGHPNTWFVQNFKKLSAENQDRVNARLVEIGHQPYGVKSKSKPVSAPREPKVLNDEQKQAEAALIKLLDEIRLDREALQQFTIELGTAEDNTRKQLAELQGVKYDGPLHDPFKNMYKSARSHSRHNKAEIEGSTKCGCFFCRAVFDPKAIYTYSEGDTAMCPNCGIDAVIGDKAGFELSDEFLVAMFRRWFSIPIRLRSIRPIGSTPRPAQPALQAPATNAPSVTDGEPAKQEFIVPPHLEEAVPAGIGAALVGSIEDDEDDEDDGVVRTIPMTAPAMNPTPSEDEEEFDDDEDDEDWDDDEDEDWDDEEDEDDDE